MFQNKLTLIYCIFVFIAVILAAPQQDQKLATSLTKRVECDFDQTPCENKCCTSKEKCVKQFSGSYVCDPGV
ncbi:hypothetical protein BJ944DRAFT_238354 [Cunninghamella echinulata]|nr:hypothetical protein BJ944DRAFT_238354 [Cunninghamella echinulata]